MAGVITNPDQYSLSSTVIAPVTVTTGYVGETSVAVLANGTVAELYTYNDGVAWHTDVNFYNEAGQLTGTVDLGITPLDPGASGVGQPQIVAGKTGGFLVYQGAVPTSGGGKDFYGATFDSSGAVVAPWQQLTSGVQVHTGWSVAALANGGYEFFWDQSNSSQVETVPGNPTWRENDDVESQTFSSTLATTGAVGLSGSYTPTGSFSPVTSLPNITDNQNAGPASTAQIANGSVVDVFTSDIRNFIQQYTNPSTTVIEMTINNGAPIVVASNPLDDSLPAGVLPTNLTANLYPGGPAGNNTGAVTALSDGRYIVTFERVDYDSTPTISGENGVLYTNAVIYNADGTVFASEQTLLTRADAQQLSGSLAQVSVAALPDGGFAIAYLNADPVADTTTDTVAIFDSNGNLQQTIAIPATTRLVNDGPGAPQLFVAPDGQLTLEDTGSGGGVYTLTPPPLTIYGTQPGQTTTANATAIPFADVTIGDTSNGGADVDTLAITLTGDGGTLSGAGLSGSNDIYTLTGTAAELTAEIRALVFTPSGAPNSAQTTTFVLNLADNLARTDVSDSATTVTDTEAAAAPTITGPSAGQTHDFVITDPNVGATDVLTIQQSGPGVLTDGAGFSGLTPSGPNAVYTISGTAAAITSEVDALNFAAVANTTTTFTLTDTTTAGTSTKDEIAYSFGAGGVTTQIETFNSDGSIHDIAYLTAGTAEGVAYASYDTAYSANERSLKTFYDASGNVVASETFLSNGGYSFYIGATQSPATLAQQKTVDAGGTYDIHDYGITGQSYTDNDVVYSANGKPTSATYSNGMTETWSYNAAGDLTEIAYSGIQGKNWDSTQTYYSQSGAVTNEVWTLNGADVETESWNADGSVAETDYYVAGNFDGVAYTSYGNLYSSGFRDQRDFFDDGNIVASETFQTNGGYSIYLGATQSPTTLAQQKTVNADGTYDIHYYGITGKSYTDYDVVYNTSGKPTSATYSNGMSETWSYDGSGVLTEIAYTGIQGQNWDSTYSFYSPSGVLTNETWTLNGAYVQTESWNADGSVHDIEHYVAGTIDGVAYADYDNAFSSGFRDLETFYNSIGAVVASETFQTNGGYALYLGATQSAATLVQQKTINPDGTYEVAYANLSGKTYTAYQNVYNAAGVLQAQSRDNTDNTGSLTLSASGLTVASTVGATAGTTQESVTVGSDSFAFNPHTSETINATASTGDTFVFTPAFGHESLTGFSSTTDVLQFNAASFGLTPGAAAQAGDLAALLANDVSANAAGAAVVTDLAGDTLTLTGVSVAALHAQANTGNIQFTGSIQST